MSRTACYVTTACVCESECDIHTSMHYAVYIHIHTYNRSKGGRELGASGERRVGGGGGAATASVPGIVIFKANARRGICKCNHRQANKYTVSFSVCFAFLLLFCFVAPVHALACALALVLSVCVCSDEASCVRYVERGGEWCAA